MASRAALRKHDLLGFRRAHEAHNDAGRVFRAASEGRPMELEKRLRFGKLAGGLELKGIVDGVGELTPLEVALLRGHERCAAILEGMGCRRPTGGMLQLARWGLQRRNG